MNIVIEHAEVYYRVLLKARARPILGWLEFLKGGGAGLSIWYVDGANALSARCKEF